MSGKMKWPKVKLKWSMPRERAGRGLKCHKTININRAPHLIEVISKQSVVQSVLAHRTLLATTPPPWTGHLCTPHLNGRFVVASFEAKKLRLMTTTCGCQMQLCVCMSVCVCFGGVPRSVVIFYMRVRLQQAGGRRRGTLSSPARFFVLGQPSPPTTTTMAYECITMAHASLTFPRALPPSLPLFPLALTQLSLPFALHFHFTWSQMSSTTPNDVFLRPWQLLQLQLMLSHSLRPLLLSHSRIHNLHINLIFLSYAWVQKKKKLSPSPKVFTTCLLMDFKWTLTHATCHAPLLQHKTDNPPCLLLHTHPHDPKKGVG